MSPGRLYWCDLWGGLLWYALSLFPVALGTILWTGAGAAGRSRPPASETTLLATCTQFDGSAYAEIARDGYSYDPHRRSMVAYFPAYPLLGRGVAAVTGWDVRLALLVVSNLALLASFVLFFAYLRSRGSVEPPAAPVVGLLALWPAGFFFRMAYSESTLLFALLLFLVGVVRRWPLPVLAALAGLATATRPVGVAATVALATAILSDPARGSLRRRVRLALGYGPIAAWGLLAYMGYQYAAFGTPLAFAQTQTHWSAHGLPPPDLREKVESLLAGEPIWGCYDPGSTRYWARGGAATNVLFNLAFWNPILFIVALGLVVLGAAQRWLSGPEVVLGVGLLAVPYLTRAYEMSMGSHARFAAVVIPAHVVTSHLLRSWPEWGFRIAYVLCAPLLLLWSALFAAGHPFF